MDPEASGYEAHAVSPVRVLVLASIATARSGLRAMLAEVEGWGIEVDGEAATLAATDPEPALGGIDVVVTADEESLEDVAHASDGDGAVVVVSGAAGVVERVRELPLRGWGVLPGNASPEELGAAILAAANGLAVTPAAPTAEPPETPAVDEPDEPLTPREGEVLGLLAAGMSNKMISHELHISEHTVKFHVSSLYAKLGVGNRAGAVSQGARRGLISL